MMTKKQKPVSPAELKVLEILWKSSPLSASQIIEKLGPSEAWHDRTIKSLINRLVTKKAIGYQQDGNRYLYYPIIKQDHYLQATSRTIIQRLFGGKISPLVAYFAKEEKISKDDLDALKAIIQELESTK